MTNSDLSEAIMEKLNMTRDKAERTVNCVFDAMTDAMSANVKISRTVITLCLL